ncbi:hypothetical protein POM88_016393 [Heracleum sosnowskyi]|uniref:SNF2 N-terminal domain-containing protein n=1 Tax=Heracleum sosnowskyi TaxID=360622 RepID=A0AAD8MSX6_9APIA|nr:hypothetical protein POM88_016393 [Heracleum sosnowskyi]
MLPKGILKTWKKEFLKWQVDTIPLLDFYSVNAKDRSQQLEVLKQWATTRSILFLGYTQFSLIVCNSTTNETSSACEKILVKQTSILIMDEGHTPRNENTDQLVALERVETPRKVFNILNLVRPRSREGIERLMKRHWMEKFLTEFLIQLDTGVIQQHFPNYVLYDEDIGGQKSGKEKELSGQLEACAIY